MHFSKFFAAAAFVASAATHPNHDVKEELRAREEAMLTLPRDLSHCAEKLAARGMTAEAAKRRAQIARKAREKRGLDGDAPYLAARDIDTVLNTTHQSPVNYTSSTSESILFAGNKSCILSPETTEGPYYVAGEFVRSDIRDGQKGVDLILDTQVIDIATCEPVDYALVEIWHCNSTGVYGGVVAQGNGVGSQDQANLYNTMLRGLQHTDSRGVSQFTTIFPGWYTGRAVHIHVLVHLNSQVLPNGHYTGGTNAHVGQLFFDQTLIDQVGKVSPYSTNKQTLMQNKADGIFSQEAVTGDPVINYSLLGSSIDMGLFGWVAFGIDTTASRSVRPAASLAATVTATNAGQQVTGVPKA